MKKIVVNIIMLLCLTGVMAQENPIKQGSKLVYGIDYDGQQMQVAIDLVEVSASSVKMFWLVDGYGSGNWIMKEASLKTGKNSLWDTPEPNVDFQVPDDRTVLYISQQQWASIHQNQNMAMDGKAYSLKTKQANQEIRINNKVIPTLLLETATGESIWILNDQNLPLLVKISGNNAGPDMELISIE